MSIITRLSLIQKLICIIALLLLCFFVVTGIMAHRALEKQVLLNITNSIGLLTASEAQNVSNYFKNLENLGLKSAATVMKWLRKETSPAELESFDRKYRLIDGAIRTDLSAFPEEDISAAFISTRGVATNELKHIMLATEGRFDDYARGTKTFVFNMYLITRHQMIRIYEKDWALEIEAEHDFSKDVFYFIADPDHNPQRTPQWTAPYYDSIWKHWMTSLITPIYEGNQFLGIVGHDVNLDAIYNEILGKQFLESGYSFIFDRKKNLIVHPDYLDRLLQTAKMGTYLSFSEIDSPKTAVAISQVVGSQSAEKAVAHEQFSDKGIVYHLFAYKLDFLDWYFGIVIPHREVVQTLDQFRGKFILGAVLVSLVLFLGIILVFWIFVVSPIGRLTAATRDIQSGRFDKRLEVKNHDEIGELSLSFNTMSAKLDRTLKKLREDIAARKQVENALRKSEARYRLIAENVADVIWTMDMDFNFTYISPSIYHQRGYSAEEVMAQKLTDVLMSDSLERAMNLFSEKIALCTARDPEGFEPVYFEAKQPRKDGSVVWTGNSARLLAGPDKKPASILGVTHDITERKHAEKALYESEEKFRKIAENSIVGVNLIQDGVLVYVNPKFAEIFGYTVEECLDKMHFSRLVYPEDLEKVQEQIRKRLEGEIGAANYAFRGLKKNGAIIHVEIFGSTTKLNGKAATAATILDITERKQLENQLQQSLKMESIGTLAGGIAHDFNNILSSIIGYTELALDDVPTGTQQEGHLQEVYTAGKRARDLVKQILAFARQSDEERKPIQVATIAKEVLRLIRSTTPSTIETRWNIESHSLIMGNPSQIHQLLMNLLTNAAQAMEDTGGILEVGLTDVDHDDRSSGSSIGLRIGSYMQITVSDTGPGIAPDILGSIFEPYFTTKGVGEGTGMGLALVHGIVESYGGKIMVESELGKGTEFKVFLPLTQRSESHGFYEKEALPTGSEHVLLVDDELAIARMGGQVLERLGYRVTVRTSSVEALELFRSKPDDFDLVITDMTMPNMTGDELTKELISVRNDIPVILCTGYSKKISDESATLIGIKAFVYKPAARVDLAKTVRKVLDESKR